MKKLIISFVLSLFSLMMYAQTYDLTISGVVTNDSTGGPVSGQEMYIRTDSAVGVGFMYYNTVLTNDVGYYEDIIQIPMTAPSALEVSTMSCGLMLSQYDYFSPNISQLTFDFQICGDPTGDDCQAMFYYYSDVNAPFSIQFIDESWGNPDTWNWEFGDGVTSTEQNPEHIYGNEGEYMVTLTIENDSNQCLSIYQELIFIGDSVWPGDCQAMFFSYPDSNDFLNINFMDISIAGGSPSGIPDTWYWDFGDGNTSTIQNPNHSYTTNGEYQVCLTITNSDSSGTYCESTECQIVYVGNGNNGCEASFWYYPADTNNPGGWNGLNIQFLDMSYGEPDQWTWDFGDGTLSSEQNPVHLFPDNGVYNVCLSIFNYVDSCESTYCEDVYVYNDTTMGCFAWYDYQISDLTVDFQAYLDGVSNNVEYTWNFGDGISGSGANITHTYIEDGVYEVLLSASDSVGCYSEYIEMIWVGNDFTFEVDGYIYLDDSMVADFADVHLMTFDTVGNGLINIATTQIDANGYYLFESVGLENCMYFVQAELTNQSAHTGSYIPTYHFSAINWEEAMPIFPFPMAWTYDVYMMSISSSGNVGNGIITGTVIEEGSREILRNVEVLLLDQDNNAILYSRTSNEGLFDFSELPYGTYIVYTEIVGIETIPFEVTLSEEMNSSNVNIIITNGQSVLGIDEVNSTYIEYVEDIYPNPVTGNANLTLNIKESSNIRIDVINQYGQNLYSNTYYLSTGKHDISLQTTSYSQGLYFVKITADDNISSVSKFVKLR